MVCKSNTTAKVYCACHGLISCPLIVQHVTTSLNAQVRHGPHAYRCTILPAPVDASASPSCPTTANQVAAAIAVATPPPPDVQGTEQGGHNAGLQDRTAQHDGERFPGGWTCWYDSVPLVVVLWGTDQGLAAGQYAVIYQGGQCLGAAQIERCVVAGELRQSLSAVPAAQAAASDGGSAALDGVGGVLQGLDWFVPRNDRRNEGEGGTGAVVLTAEL
eukprot:1159516-Pelagomonas_calceolata.AAC.23